MGIRKTTVLYIKGMAASGQTEEKPEKQSKCATKCVWFSVQENPNKINERVRVT